VTILGLAEDVALSAVPGGGFIVAAKKVLAAVPWRLVAWLIAVALVLVAVRADLAMRRNLATMTAWQVAVVTAASDAYNDAPPGAKYRVYKPVEVVSAIEASGRSIKTLRDGLGRQTIAVNTAVANGIIRQARAHAATLDGDRAKAAAATALDRLRHIEPPAAPSTDAAEALTLGRADWSSLR
jgi:hypothetical protein